MYKSSQTPRAECSTKNLVFNWRLQHALKEMVTPENEMLKGYHIVSRAHLSDMSHLKCSMCDGYGHRANANSKSGEPGCPTRSKFFSLFGVDKNRAPHSILATAQYEVEHDDIYMAGFIKNMDGRTNLIGQQLGNFYQELWRDQFTDKAKSMQAPRNDGLDKVREALNNKIGQQE